MSCCPREVAFTQSLRHASSWSLKRKSVFFSFCSLALLIAALRAALQSRARLSRPTLGLAELLPIGGGNFSLAGTVQLRSQELSDRCLKAVTQPGYKWADDFASTAQMRLERLSFRGKAAVEANASRRLGAEAAAGCQGFVRRRGYFTATISEEERSFPIAFSVLMYHRPAQFERLLRAIYAPHNFYCVHVDRKAAQFVHDTVSAIAHCFPNVYMIKSPITVRWATISVLAAERLCQRHLLQRSRRWRYYINLTGEEFPLWSNRHLVRILKAFNGANNIDAIKRPQRRLRWEFRWQLRNGAWTRTDKRKAPPPHNLTISHGEVHIAASREYMELIMTHPVAVDLYRWLSDAHVPDEMFYHTVNHNPQVVRARGGYDLSRLAVDRYDKGYTARLKHWRDGRKCHGVWQREICVLGPGDLSTLRDAKQLFVNKFDVVAASPLAFKCAEEFQLRRTIESTRDNFTFDASYYSSLTFVKFQIKP